MWYIKFSWTVLVFAVLFTVVTGSCLEYGHSCWGAHGKRSGDAGTTGTVAVKQPVAFADNLAEQFFNRHNNNNNNNNNNVNAIDEDSSSSGSGSNNNNSNNYDLPQAARSSDDEAAVDNGSKWAQLVLRQHRQQQQLRQLQRQFDAVDAAESWRKLQLALAEAEQRQRLQQQQQQQQQAMPIGDFFELNK